ncbi:MAG: amidohydrolase [Firmicutes bacterium]|nr:amidohydrolase [Bacillota bacterium]
MKFLAAAVQFEPAWGRPAENLERLLDLSRRAADAGARLIVWPEMATTGYIFADRAEIAPFVEPLPGPTFERVAAFCRERQVFVAYGLAEVDPDTGVYYNSAVLVDSRGRLAARYRKTHLWVEDTRWAAPGQEWSVVSTDLGRVALLVCRDADFPEAARILALQGADLVIHPTNWLGRTPANVWRARAAENGVFWIATNRWGEERGARFSGGSCVIGPDGEVLDAKGPEGDGVAMAVVSVDRARDKARPDLDALDVRADDCQELLLNPHLYPPRRGPFKEGRVVVVQAGEAPSSPSDVKLACERQLIELLNAEAPPALVVLPALVDVTDVRGARDVAAWAEPLPGPSSDWLLEWARRLDTRIASALLEWADGELYLTTVLVGPGGVEAKKRSGAIPKAARAWCGSGAGDVWVDLPLGRVGLAHLAELRQPEALRRLAQRGCRLVAAPGGGEAGRPWLWSARAEENDLCVAVANRDTGGGSFVYGDRREEAARAPLAEPGRHEYLLPARADWLDDKSTLRMRPVHLYLPLVERGERRASRGAG